MIKNPEKLEAFQDAYLRTAEPLPYHQASKIFTALWQEGVTLGVLPPSNPLEGIETDIRIARILNSCLKNSSQL